METGVEGSLRWPHSKAANRLSRHSDPFRWPSSLLSAFKACPQQRSADPDSVAGALSDLRASPDKWRGATREGGGACGKRRSSALLLRPACLLMSQLCSGVMTEELLSEELVDPGPSGAKGMSACYRKQLGRQTAFCVVRVDSPSLTGSTATNCCMHDSPLQALGLLRAARPRLEISARMLEQGVRRTRRGSEMGHSAHLLAIPDGEPAVRRTHSI